MASEFVTDAFWFAQNGQPRPPVVRPTTRVDHSWSGPAGHVHHTLVPLRAGTVAGVSWPLRTGCHCAATSGYKMARLFVGEARLFVQ